MRARYERNWVSRARTYNLDSFFFILPSSRRSFVLFVLNRFLRLFMSARCAMVSTWRLLLSIFPLYLSRLSFRSRYFLPAATPFARFSLRHRMTLLPVDLFLVLSVFHLFIVLNWAAASLGRFKIIFFFLTASVFNYQLPLQQQSQHPWIDSIQMKLIQSTRDAFFSRLPWLRTSACLS